jgi:orotate phosphoribosyltransferase-like protein
MTQEELVKTAKNLRAKGLTFKETAKEMQKQKLKNSWGNPISAFNVQSYCRTGKKTAQTVRKVAIPKKEPIVMKWSQVTRGDEAETLELITAIVQTSLPPARKLTAIRRFVQ